jgi:hypothetical protein
VIVYLPCQNNRTGSTNCIVCSTSYPTTSTQPHFTMDTPTAQLIQLCLRLWDSTTNDPHTIINEYITITGGRTGKAHCLDAGMVADELYTDIGRPLLRNLRPLRITVDEARERNLQGACSLCPPCTCNIQHNSGTSVSRMYTLSSHHFVCSVEPFQNTLYRL